MDTQKDSTVTCAKCGVVMDPKVDPVMTHKSGRTVCADCLIADVQRVVARLSRQTVVVR